LLFIKTLHFEVKLDNKIIGYSDLGHHGDAGMGCASGRFVPAPAYASVRQYFIEHLECWVPMPSLKVSLTGGGPIECLGGVQVLDFSAASGEDTIELNIAGITHPPYVELFPDYEEVQAYQVRKRAEARLVEEIQSYLPVHGCGDESEREQLRQVCSALERLLGELLREEEMWSPHFWVDGVLASIEIPSPRLLHLQGLAIWGDRGTSKQWWEPFSASLHVPERSNELLHYEIMFADSALGLGKVPYNTHPRGWNCALPDDWLFVFTKG
jgi:hypothetical protein